MSVDLLHEKVRKLKNPSMVDLCIKPELLPQHLLAEEGNTLAAYGRFCRELMDGLKGIVPALRFPFADFALFGAEGMTLLSALLQEAKEMEFYTVLEAPDCFAPWSAERAAEMIFGGQQYPCDALIISPYIGSDSIKPFLPYCKDNNKALCVIA